HPTNLDAYLTPNLTHAGTFPMNSIDELVARAERLAEREALALSTVSRKLLNDGKGLNRLKSGGQLTLRTLETAFERLSVLENGEKPAAKTALKPQPKSAPMTAPLDDAAKGGADLISPQRMSHLDRLEAEAIHIMREVAA